MPTNTPDLDWKILFETLLSNKMVFDLVTNENEIIITANKENAKLIELHLQKTLSSSASFKDSLPYVIKQKIFSEPSAHIQKNENHEIKYIPIPTIPNDIEAGKKMLFQLFGEEAFDNLSINVNSLFDKNKGATIKDGVLFSKPAQLMTLDAWKEIIKYFQAYFKDIPTERIRRALDPENGTPLNKPHDDKKISSLTIEGLGQQCFGVLQNSSKKELVFYFNYQRLLQLVFPPLIEKRNNPNNSVDTVTMAIQKNDLIPYLQQLLNGDLLLKLYKKDNKELVAKPIFLNSESTIKQPRHCILVIDRSGSMQNYFLDLKNKVLQFIENLRLVDQDMSLSFVFFEANTSDMKEFTIDQKDEINQFIQQVEIGGATRLYGTLVDVFQKISTEQSTREKNTSIVFFSDGYDTVDNSLSVQNKNKPQINGILKKFNHQDNLPSPKMFTFGFGDCDEKILQDITKELGGVYHYLKNIKDFDIVTKHIETMQKEQVLLKLLYDISNQKKEVLVTVPRNNAPVIPDITIPVRDNGIMEIEINGHSFEILVDPKKVELNDREFLLKKECQKLISQGNNQDSKTIHTVELCQRFFNVSPRRLTRGDESEIKSICYQNDKAIDRSVSGQQTSLQISLFQQLCNYLSSYMPEIGEASKSADQSLK